MGDTVVHKEDIKGTAVPLYQHPISVHNHYPYVYIFFIYPGMPCMPMYFPIHVHIREAASVPEFVDGLGWFTETTSRYSTFM